MRFARFVRLTLSALTLSASLSAPAVADDHRVYFSFSGENRLPVCTAASVKSAVSGAIARARKDYYGGRTILSLDEISEVGYGQNGVSPVARRYCRGKAGLSDGSFQSVQYMVEEHAGFVGVGWNVEACLSPLDTWRVYGVGCSTVRPH
ncbi:cytoplasmic protein [Roseibium sp.]|uniref:cytoplasmic protein n=1 Tax=Roseibium sp. TaxID=1936156 RepID=UPI003265DB07